MLKKNQIYSFTFLLILISGLLQDGALIRVSSVPITQYPHAASVTGNNSIILFIGDGTSLAQIQLGQYVEYGVDGNGSFHQFPYETTVNTINIDNVVTDSAAGATVISTGTKTTNGAMATSWNGQNLTTILEIAQSKGYATGLVVTCYLTHATPAAFASHNPSRGNNLAIGADIARHNVDVLLGGGSDDDYMGTYVSGLQSRGYQYVTNRTTLNITATAPVIGLFQPGYLPKEMDRVANSTVPTLQEMTSKAIVLLQSTGKPYFLMVEGSQIDSGCHAKDKQYAAHEVIELEKCVAYAQSIARNDPNLLVLVTGDHETGGLDINAQNLKSPVPLPSDNLTTQIAKRNARIEEIDVTFTSGGSHTARKVLLAGMGPYAERIITAKHHTDTFSIMRMAIEQQEDPVEKNISITYRILLWVGVGVVSALGLVGIVIGIKKIIVKRGKRARTSEGTLATL